MNEPTLFNMFSGDPVPPPPSTSRRSFIDDALERQADEFKKAFRQFASEFYKANRGTAADVIAEYKLTALPKPVKDYRCTGAIFMSMVHRGEIKSVGTVKAGDGSGRNMDVYARVI